jgi:hypothetical protein
MESMAGLLSRRETPALQETVALAARRLQNGVSAKFAAGVDAAAPGAPPWRARGNGFSVEAHAETAAATALRR